MLKNLSYILQYWKFMLQHTNYYPAQHQWVITQSFGASDLLVPDFSQAICKVCPGFLWQKSVSLCGYRSCESIDRKHLLRMLWCMQHSVSGRHITHTAVHIVRLTWQLSFFLHWILLMFSKSTTAWSSKNWSNLPRFHKSFTWSLIKVWPLKGMVNFFSAYWPGRAVWVVCALWSWEGYCLLQRYAAWSHALD